MAVRELGPASLRVVQAISHRLAQTPPTPSSVPPPARLHVRLGVSGGADSMALAAGVAHLRRRGTHLDAEALVVDHGLFEGSAGHTSDVVGRLRAMGLPATSARVTVSPAGSIEDTARRARYEALATHPPLADATPLTEVWLAHTLDDQAETVLLQLARGSGTHALAGMPAERDHRTASGTTRIVRPLLGLRRSDTEQACREWGLEVWADPANTDQRFRRSALRAGMSELSRLLDADLAPHLARTADLARADDDLLDELAASAATRAADGAALVAAELAAQPAALRGRVVRRWLLGLGCPQVSREHVERVLDLVVDWHGQGPVHLPGGIAVGRRDARLCRC